MVTSIQVKTQSDKDDIVFKEEREIPKWLKEKNETCLSKSNVSDNGDEVYKQPMPTSNDKCKIINF